MGKKILIAFASKYGSTREVAHAIEQRLYEKGASVEVWPVESVNSLDGYSAVIMGSAIRFGQWLPEALNFVKKFKAPLNRMPTAIFSVHMLALDDSETSRKQRQSYTEPVRKILTPEAEIFFAGKIEPERLSFIERLMARAVHAPAGDLLDWQVVRDWADELYPALIAKSSSDNHAERVGGVTIPQVV